jgi:hypothetical protein
VQTVNEPTSLSYALTYAGTLGVAGLMFLGQLVAFIALLVLAGTVRLFTLAGLSIARLSSAPRDPTRQ